MSPKNRRGSISDSVRKRKKGTRRKALRRTRLLAGDVTTDAPLNIRRSRFRGRNHSTNKIRCPECETEFSVDESTSKNSMIKRKARININRGRKSLRRTEKKKFTCPNCGYTFFKRK